MNMNLRILEIIHLDRFSLPGLSPLSIMFNIEDLDSLFIIPRTFV